MLKFLKLECIIFGQFTYHLRKTVIASILIWRQINRSKKKVKFDIELILSLSKELSHTLLY